MHGLDGVQGLVLILQSVGTVPMQLHSHAGSVLSFLSQASLFPVSSQIHAQIEAGSFGGSPRGLIRLEDLFPTVLHLDRHLSGLPILS